MATLLGLNAKLYFKVGGVSGGGSWTEVANIVDVTLGLTKESADVTTRGSGRFRQKIGTLLEAPVEFQMIWDTADAAFTAFKNSFFTGSIVGLQILDQPLASGGQGLQADFECMELPREEPLADAIKVKVKMEITRSTYVPAWIP